MFGLFRKKQTKKLAENLLKATPGAFADAISKTLGASSPQEKAMILIGYIKARVFSEAITTVEASINIAQIVIQAADSLDSVTHKKETPDNIRAKYRGHWLFYGLLIHKHFLDYTQQPELLREQTLKIIFSLLGGSEGLQHALSTMIWDDEEKSWFDYVNYEKYQDRYAQERFTLETILAVPYLKILNNEPLIRQFRDNQ